MSVTCVTDIYNREEGHNRGRAYCHVLRHEDAQEWIDRLNTSVKGAKVLQRVRCN